MPSNVHTFILALLIVVSLDICKYFRFTSRQFAPLVLFLNVTFVMYSCLCISPPGLSVRVRHGHHSRCFLAEERPESTCLRRLRDTAGIVRSEWAAATAQLYIHVYFSHSQIYHIALGEMRAEEL